MFLIAKNMGLLILNHLMFFFIEIILLSADFSLVATGILSSTGISVFEDCEGFLKKSTIFDMVLLRFFGRLSGFFGGSRNFTDKKCHHLKFYSNKVICFKKTCIYN